MPDEGNERHEINRGQPPHYTEEYHALLQLRYRIDEENVYHFDYRVRTVTKLRQGFLHSEIEDSKWITLLEKADSGEVKYRAEIDIGIEGDTIVEVQTIDNFNFRGLYWSQKKPAIVTKKKKDHLFGELRYYHNGEWRETIPTVNCRKMYFKANYNEDRKYDPEGSHEFAFNVRVNGREIEVDPDIKNPSV